MSFVLSKLQRLFIKTPFLKIAKVAKQFEQQTNLPLESFIAELNSILEPVLNLAITSKVVFYKGANNVCFIEHYADKKLICISKVAQTHLIMREHAFFDWQQQNHSDQQLITPKAVNFFQINGSKISCLTMEALHECRAITSSELLQLYQAYGDQSKYLDNFSSAKKVAKGYQFQLPGSTKIIDVLNGLVTNMLSPEAYVFASNYLKQREKLFINDRTAYLSIESLIKRVESDLALHDVTDYYGLIHGDFKSNNMMKNSGGELKVLDMQYYHYGARLWDLAFYCSKLQLDFNVIRVDYLSPLELSSIEERMFTLFYIMALLLHAKPAKMKKMLQNKICYAIEFAGLS